MGLLDGLSDGTKKAIFAGVLSGHPAWQEFAAELQDRERWCSRLAALYRVTPADVAYTATTYPWTFDHFCVMAMDGRVTMVQRPAE